MYRMIFYSLGWCHQKKHAWYKNMTVEKWNTPNVILQELFFADDIIQSENILQEWLLDIE